MHAIGAVHCEDEVFEPGSWTLCGRRRSTCETRPAVQFDAYNEDSRCGLCSALRRLISKAPLLRDHPFPPSHTDLRSQRPTITGMPAPAHLPADAAETEVVDDPDAVRR